jgi:F0F1-type ATP synthase assembly protein I
MAGGWLLDGWLRVTPLFSIIGALVGAALGSVSIYRRLLGSGDREDGGGR